MKQSLTQLVMNDFFIIGTQDMKLTQLMKMIIEQSEYIYIYRRLLHIMEEPEIVKWAKENKKIEVENIKISYPKYDREDVIKSQDDKKIYIIDLNQDDNREKISEMMKISIRDITNRLDTKELEEYYNNKLYIDNPIYDQYDFIFTLDNEVLMDTFIHDFSFVINGKLK